MKVISIEAKQKMEGKKKMQTVNGTHFLKHPEVNNSVIRLMVLFLSSTQEL